MTKTFAKTLEKPIEKPFEKQMPKPLGTRTNAALVLKDVIVNHQSLTSAIDNKSQRLLTADISLLKAICFGVLRHYPSLCAKIDPWLDKPLRNKDKDIYALLLIGAYQLRFMRVPEYAAIDSCVNASKELKKPWAAALINAVLRKFQSNSTETFSTDNPQIQSEHPQWLYDAIVSAWPNYAADIFLANNQEPPFCLRVNTLKISRLEYQQKLVDRGIHSTLGEHSPVSIYLVDKPQNIFDLPQFREGECSVQDEAPQLSAFLLDLAPQQRVLDACAAPGGKTCHILETEPQLLELVAVDHDAKRLLRVEENLSRLNLKATCVVADILEIEKWWDGEYFDRILCDVPCSATGVIRRHPDIKLLRRPSDIAELAATQLAILKTLWQTLKPEGILLYATCSILPAENCNIIRQFCASEINCEEITIDLNCGLNIDAVQQHGRQLLPQIMAHDGFYYAKLRKKVAKKVS